MPLECSRGRELPELVPHHILGNKDLMEHLAVVNHERETHELRNNRTPSGPGLYWLTGSGSNLPVDLVEHLLINKRSFF